MSSRQFPGKIILCGEHAVVHGYPGLVATFNKYARADVSQSGTEIAITSDRFETEKFSVDDLDSNARAPQLLLDVLEHVYKLLKTEPRGLKIHVSSDLPIGGFGSSTAIAAAVAQATVSALGESITKDELSDLLVKAETQFQGTVSGIDQTVIVNGGIMRFQKGNEGNAYTDVAKHSSMLNDVIVLYLGRPADTTGEVVAWVKNKLSESPAEVKEIFEGLTEQTDRMQSAIESGDHSILLDTVSRSGLLLEQLGIVRPASQEIINDLRDKLEVAVKVSGAGAITGSGSGVFLALSDDQDKVAEYLQSKGLVHYRTPLG